MAVRRDESPWEDPRLATRRQKVKFNFNALRRQIAERPIEAPGRLRTILGEFRWRRQLRRSLSGGGMSATAWMIALLFLRADLLGIVVLIKIL
jgi:hypothetical protein